MLCDAGQGAASPAGASSPQEQAAPALPGLLRGRKQGGMWGSRGAWRLEGAQELWLP